MLALLAAAPARAAEDAAVLHDRCVAFAQKSPQEGLARARQWQAEGGGPQAGHCAAMALVALGDFRAAAAAFEDLATRSAGFTTEQRLQILDQAGQAWLAADDVRHARADFDAALKLDAGNPDLLIDHAEALAVEQDYQGAIADLDRAIVLAPKRADAYIFRAAAHRAQGKLDDAAGDVEEGLKLAPDDVAGLLERGNIRRLKGDVPGARADWRRILALAPHSPAAQAARANLDRLGGGESKNEDQPQRQ